MEEDSEMLVRDVDRRELLEQVLRVVAALDGADAFPQDREGIEALIGRLAEGRPSEPRAIVYEDPAELPRYGGDLTTWIGPAGDGTLRARRESFGSGPGPSSQTVVVRADGRTGDFATIEGFGVPDSELTEQARADLDAHERRRREAEEEEPAHRARVEEDQTRFRTANLIRTVAGPPARDPTEPAVAYVVLYSTGFSVDYLIPRPAAEVLDPDDPWAEPLTEAMFPAVEIDDGLETEYKMADLDYVDGNSSPLRGRMSFTPAIPAAASFLRITIDGTAIGLDLETP